MAPTVAGCGHEGRAKAVAIYNIAAGAFHLMLAVTGMSAVSPVNTDEIAGYFIASCCSIAVGILLLLGIERRSRHLLTVWCAVDGILTALYAAGFCYLVIKLTDLFAGNGPACFPDETAYLAVHITVTVSLIFHVIASILCIGIVLRCKSQAFEDGHRLIANNARKGSVTVQDFGETTTELD